ncbi:DUF1929 domain-containing protein [Variovorax dokdonensis]|uniref:DUF1929 domain-containing protein n=1 Tax=Variovorax dokdonensis TaxID=344883 RepID=A0ABT7N7V6_9BURK|nr:DUF1929 domain-containing protein [Variovorax dokdonensis]
MTSLLAACGGGSDNRGPAASSNPSGSGTSAGSVSSGNGGSEATLQKEQGGSSRTESAIAGSEGVASSIESPSAESDDVTTRKEPVGRSPEGDMLDNVSNWLAEHLWAAPIEPAVQSSRGPSLRMAVVPSYGPQAATQGAWTTPRSWPLIAIHASLMPDGRVATYGTNANGQQTGRFIYDLWDSDAADLDVGHMTLPNTTSTDLFCNAQTLIPGAGELFLAGGDNFVNGHTTNSGNNNSVILSSSAKTLRPGNNLNRPRWYGTVTTMADSRIFINGGSGGTDRPEVREKNGTFTFLNGADTTPFDYFYPRNFLTSDNRIFGFDVVGRSYTIDPRDGGYVQRQTNLVSDFVSSASGAAMYTPGEVLQVGAQTNRVMKISINKPTPTFVEVPRTSTNRVWGTATVLPDGRVLMTGGSSQDNKLVNVNNSAELWNPSTGQWTRGAVGTHARLYHSIALLLPDATVLVAGGGAPGPLTNTNAERYMPSYLFDSTGRAAPRPQIISATETVAPGQMLTMGVAGGNMSQVVLIRAGSVTHSVSFDQRRIVLAHQQTGSTITAHVPTNGAIVPPGYYLLFVLDANRVPSMAKIIQVNEGNPQNIGADWTGTIGGTGGSPFTLECSADEALVGIHGSSGAVVDRVGPQCVRVDAAGRWMGEPVNRGAAGGIGGGAFARTCARNYGVTGMSGRSSNLVYNLQMSCSPLVTIQQTSGIPTPLASVGGGGGVQRALRSCGLGGVGRGLYGRSGGMVDAVGLLCRSEDRANAFPFFATSNTITHGAAGGEPGPAFSLSCQSDEVLAGVSGAAGWVLDRLSPLCVKVDAEGKWTSDPMARGAAGSLNGNMVARLCPSGQAVSGFVSRSGWLVDRLAPTCQPLVSAGRVSGATTVLAGFGGNGGGENPGVVCDSGRPAHGVIGRANGAVSSIGLTCRGD